MPRSFIHLAAGLIALLSACSSSVEPLRVPDAAAVSSIEGTISNSYDIAAAAYRDSVAVTDPARIKRIIEFLTTLNSNMVVPPGTFPTPSHTLEFKDVGGVNLVVYIGLNWVGGRNNVQGGSQNRLRNISNEQRTQLLQLVGLKDYRF